MEHFSLELVIIIIVLWTLPWKGIALWKAARSGDNVWFVVLLVLNTLAILEISYIFFFSRKRKKLISNPRINPNELK